MPYRIKTVARMVDVPRATLLAWERRYAVVKPARHENGYRAYSEDDIAVLREVKALVDQGLKVSEAVSRVREEKGRKPKAGTSSLDLLREEMKAALMAFDRDTALSCAQRVGLLGFDMQLEQLYVPLMRDVGEAWSRGDITISREHFATGFVRERVTAMLVALNSGPRDGPRVICSGFDDDPHELPTLIVATYLALAGYRATPIGVLMPVDALARAAVDTQAQLICVSATAPRSVDAVNAYLAQLVARLPPGCVVAVGGPGIPHGIHTSERVHAPASVAQLIALGRQLTR